MKLPRFQVVLVYRGVRRRGYMTVPAYSAAEACVKARKRSAGDVIECHAVLLP